MQIAVAGLGRMGAGMARRLAQGGHEVVAWNRHAQVAHDLAAESVAFPMVQVLSPLADAFFEPLVARRLVSVRTGRP